jgi:hypothetical protein
LAKVNRALELNELAFDGPLASYLSTAAGMAGVAEETVAATKALDSILSDLVASTVKQFGANPTDKEAEITERVSGAVWMNREERAAALNELLIKIEAELPVLRQRREAIIRGEYGRTNPNYTSPPPQPRRSEPPPQPRRSEPPPDFIVVDPRNPRGGAPRQRSPQNSIEEMMAP